LPSQPPSSGAEIWDSMNWVLELLRAQSVATEI